MPKSFSKYDHKKIEAKWQKEWNYKTPDSIKGEKNFYHLAMLPYVSGDLHIGHWYNFSVADIYARWKRMQGFNVLSPIGFDAFGLPAENAAIKDGIHPQKRTSQNINKMRQQLKSIGAVYDWSREINTSSPDYYKWTQWIFLQLYKHGLAYKKKTSANWCTSCNTVLANEQVINSKCERCNSSVVRKEISQWLLKITTYTERLLEDLDELDWPDRTKIMQRNWIGKSIGSEIDFSRIKVFTTRADTIMGATFIVLSPDHPRVKKYKNSEVTKYLNRSDLGRSKEKTGVFTGDYVVNPATKEKIPVWVADYVMMEYGTGAIMAVPDHDERDKEFAEKYNLPIKKTKLVDTWGKPKVNYKLRDWLISRQRYWGAPIPIIYCDKCGELPVPEKDLPIELPDDVDFRPTGESPLARSKKFHKVKCPKCKSPAKRESDTMDTFVCSSWYYLRYLDSKNTKEFADKEKIKKWMPVDIYIGGAEHTVLHLLYSRFFTKFLKDYGYINMTSDEPFKKLRHQGMILGPDGQKMSKSRGNVVDPDDLVNKYGSDTVRMHLGFMGPYNQGGPWNPNAIIGIRKFLDKVYNLKKQKRDNQITHKTIKKVTKDIDKLKFNTAIACLMEYVNSKEYDYEILLKLLAPFAPHLTAELWPSVHEERWPEYDEDKIKEKEIELIVQINGKVRDKLKVKAGISQKEVEKLLAGKYQYKRAVFVPDRLINLVLTK